MPFDANFDYLLLLGVEPAQVLRAPASLAETIRTRRKEWTGQVHNPLYQQAARSSLERTREFEALLKEPDALAAYVNGIQQRRAAARAGQKETVALLVLAAAAGKG